MSTHDWSPSSVNHYETRSMRLKQRQELLHAIEMVDLLHGRDLIVNHRRGRIPQLSGIVEPKHLSRFLWHAVKARDNVLVEELLRNHKPKLTTPEGYDESMLWVAVKNVDMLIARLLIDAGADLNEKLASDPDKPSLLHAVIMWWQKYRDIEIAMHMIDRGADVNARDARGNSVLHAAMLYDVEPCLVTRLLERGADIHAVNDEGYDLLLTAACNPCAETLLPILVGYKLEEDETTRKKRAMTALQYLIITGDEQKLGAVSKLLEMNLPVNELDDGGLAHIHWAVSIDGIEAVKLLLDFGADPNIKSRGGTFPLLEAAKLPKSCMTRLLVKMGADVHQRHNDGRHPLHAACVEASLQNIHFLLQLGADINAVDKSGCTPFNYLVLRKTNLACVKLILKHLALLQTKGVKIHKNNMQIIANKSTVSKYYEECLSELRQMQEVKIYNNISFFCFFSKSPIELSKLIRNPSFVESYKNRNDILFPLYLMQMKYAYAIAERVKNVLQSNENILHEVFHGIISDLAIEKIAAYLSCDKLTDLQQKFYFLLHKNINEGVHGFDVSMLR